MQVQSLMERPWREEWPPQGSCPSALTLSQAPPREESEPPHSPVQFRALITLEIGEKIRAHLPQMPHKKAGTGAGSGS